MRRRDFIKAICGFAGAWPLLAKAQQSRTPTIGYFSARSAKTDAPMLAAFRQGLNDSGYFEGRNVGIEFRFADGQFDRYPTMAAELVAKQVNIIVAAGGEGTALATKSATATIPIVFVVGDDPVRVGLVESLSRPGGNLTGVTTLQRILGPKNLGLLKDISPSKSIIAMLVNPNEITANSQIEDAQAAARAAGLQLVVLRAGTETEIESAFASLIPDQVSGILVASGPFFVTRQDKIISLAANRRLPTIYPRREYALAGGLISHGTSTTESYHQIGVYVGKILNGAKPTELPVVQPTKFELVINLKTARTLGLTLPPGILAIANEVIE